jgi:hypothetical protein
MNTLARTCDSLMGVNAMWMPWAMARSVEQMGH